MKSSVKTKRNSHSTYTSIDAVWTRKVLFVVNALEKFFDEAVDDFMDKEYHVFGARSLDSDCQIKITEIGLDKE